MTDIRRCYGENPNYEWRRLVKNQYNNLEFQTTMFYLKKHLPKNGTIIDVGGGPGRYTIELAKMGYNVVLFDYSPALLRIARREIKKAGVEKKVDVFEGSMTDMSMFDDKVFDSAVCLGAAMGHVEGEGRRNKALSEMKRITKKGGFIFISVIGRLRAIMNGPRYWSNEIRITKHFKRSVSSGDDHMWHGKYYSHLFLPEEFNSMFKKQKIELVESVGLEGLATRDKEGVNSINFNDRKFWKNWLWMHYKLCTNPHVVANSDHFMVIGKVK
jgi:ubiquinone/menaquinone biosynthesis C-methylase UbiE